MGIFKILLICILFFFQIPMTNGFFEQKLHTPYSIALGGGIAGKTSDSSGLYYNPAALSFMENTHIGISGSTFFNINDLFNTNLSLGFPGKKISFAAGLGSFGCSFYRENSLILSSSFNFSGQIMVGVSVKLFHLDIAGFNSLFIPALDSGLLLSISPEVTIGFYIHNLIHSPPGPYSSGSISPELGAGGNWEIKKYFMFFFSIVHHTSPSIHLGLEYQFNKNIRLRCGFQSASKAFSGGFGIYLTGYRIDYSWLSFRGDLGESHTIGITCRLRTSPSDSKKKDFFTKKSKTSFKLININTASFLLLRSIHKLTTTQIKAILLYRKSGRRFSHTMDICRIRGITMKTYLSIMEKIYTDKTGLEYFPLKKLNKSGLKPNEMEMADLIKAGISAFNARTIILYRDRIGGFTKLKELYTIPGLSQKATQQFQKLLND